MVNNSYSMPFKVEMFTIAWYSIIVALFLIIFLLFVVAVTAAAVSANIDVNFKFENDGSDLQLPLPHYNAYIFQNIFSMQCKISRFFSITFGCFLF